MLTSGLPHPPQQGGALRALGILRGLHENGHSVVLLSFCDPTDNDPRTTPLADYCQRIETIPMPHRTRTHRIRDLILTTKPDIAGRLSSDVMRDKLRVLLTSSAFDVVQFEGIEMAIYLPFAREIVRQHRLKTHLIYDSFNAEAALQRIIAKIETRNPRRLPAAIYSTIQAGRIARFERHICETADTVIAVSPEDAESLKPFRRDGKIYVVPNGIFTENYDEHPQKLDLGERVLVFTGKMDYRPNVDAALWFTDDVLPLIHADCGDTRLYIVGQKPHASLQGLREKDNIEVTGWVPDVQPYLHAASVYVAPLRMGSGTRLKILEAMAAGCAIVATSIAASGLSEPVRQAICIADTAEDMARAVCDLLKDVTARNALGTAAQRAVKQYYDWSALIPSLLNTYREIGLG